jgi:hypothetical protein
LAVLCVDAMSGALHLPTTLEPQHPGGRHSSRANRRWHLWF